MAFAAYIFWRLSLKSTLAGVFRIFLMAGKASVAQRASASSRVVSHFAPGAEWEAHHWLPATGYRSGSRRTTS